MYNIRIDGHPFAESAQDFCTLVEQIEGHQPDQWLRAIGDILLRLESSITELAALVLPAPHAWISDLEKRFELFSRLKDFLGTKDEYWSEADLHAGDGYMTGSLSDDFADIYFELKRGLLLASQGREGQHEALQVWINGYREHWKQHLTDARKQIFEFRVTATSPAKPARKPHVHRPPKKPV